MALSSPVHRLSAPATSPSTPNHSRSRSPSLSSTNFGSSTRTNYDVNINFLFDASQLSTTSTSTSLHGVIAWTDDSGVEHKHHLNGTIVEHKSNGAIPDSAKSPNSNDVDPNIHATTPPPNDPGPDKIDNVDDFPNPNLKQNDANPTNTILTDNDDGQNPKSTAMKTKSKMSALSDAAHHLNLHATDSLNVPSHHKQSSNVEPSDDDNKSDEFVQSQKSLSRLSSIDHDDPKLEVTIDRYGFPIEDDAAIDEKEHRKHLRKENARLLKWQEMVLPRNLGGARVEASDNLDELIKHWNHVKNHRKLKSRVRKGIPQQLRGTIWQNLSGARERKKIECARYGSKYLYMDLKKRKRSKWHEQIWKDINRTYRKHIAHGSTQLATAQSHAKNTEHNKRGVSLSGHNDPSKPATKFFKHALHDPSKMQTPQDLERNPTENQIKLYNVLKSFSLYRKDIGYCQGMQAVVALLLFYMTEEEAFWVLASLADDTKYQMDNLWRPTMPAINLRFYQMERLVKINLPKLAEHFEKHSIINASMYQASQWFITIFLATEMKMGVITRVWDIYLNEGLKTIFRMGLGFLKYFQKQLLKSDMEDMLELFRSGASRLEPEEYIKVCFDTRITHAQLAAFEKDFNRQQQQGK